MKERPILFSAPMVRAILEGRKTQTRRIVKPQPTHFNPAGMPRRAGPAGGPSDVIACPHGQAGDRLWVRETWGVGSRPDPFDGWYEGIEYRADVAYLDDDIENIPCHRVATPDDVEIGDYRSGWRPSIFMPRWASRITLEITGVRVERLQGISDIDAIAEGIEKSEESPRLWKRGRLEGDQNTVSITAFPHLAFRSIWESINGPNAWAANPFVWVVAFKRVEQQ